jgi:NAD(P)-dependent dehydrogenase (short-subunit alcohol dehydrogenase family)
MKPTLIISGATRGIGRSILEKFLQNGFDAAFCGSKQSDTDRVAEELSAVYPNSRVFGFAADLRNKAETELFGREAMNKLGHCTVLICNAGLFRAGGILTEDEGCFEEQMNLNLGHVYHLVRAIVPTMKSQSRAHVFTMCSIASIQAYPAGGSYCISKFALLGLTKELREELKPIGICVTAVMPGATYTDSWKPAGLPETRFIKTSAIAEQVFAAWQINESACVEEVLIRPLAGDI